MQKQRLRTAALAAAIVAVFLAGEARPCTSIMVGRKASADGSVMTSHTCDSHDGSSQIFIVPAAKHAARRTGSLEPPPARQLAAR